MENGFQHIYKPQWISCIQFGLTNAPAVFQALVNDVQQDFLNIFVFVYLDDILIFSHSLNSHRLHARQILQRLLEYKLFSRQRNVNFIGTFIELFFGLHRLSLPGRDGSFEIKGGSGLAHPFFQTWPPTVPGVCQFLQVVHQRLQFHGWPPHHTHLY